MRKYLIVASGYNAGSLVYGCWKSLVNLRGNFDWEAILISDGSTDSITNDELSKITDKRIKIEIYQGNMGATYRRDQAIESAGLKDTDVIILLGLDDRLFPNALTVIDAQYEQGKWMTYGNWVNQKGIGLPPGFRLSFPNWVHDENAYRKVQYRSTAPNTFMYGLYKRIPKDRFLINDKWINTTTESEVMFSCLEMSGKNRQGIIRTPIYLYNQHNNSSLKRLGRDYKYETLTTICEREPMERLNNI